MIVAASGNTNQYTFLDKDLDFKIPTQTTFTFFNSLNNIPNKAVPTPTQSSSTSQFVVAKTNLPQSGPLQPVPIYYWVIAQFADGSTSPLAGFVHVSVQ